MSRREEIMGMFAPLSPKETDIPEWGGKFKLLPLNGAQVEEISLLAEQAKATGNYLCLRQLRGRVAVWTVAEAASDRPVFKPADAQTLTERFPAVLMRLWEEVKRHNGLTDDGEAIEKN